MADFEAIFMDAGQGDCTLIVYPNGDLLLVDCGSTKSGTQAFAEIKKVIDRKIQENPKTNIMLVLTHPDEDHYNLLWQLELDKKGQQTLTGIYYGGHIKLYNNKKDQYDNTRKEGYTFGLLKHYADNKLASAPPVEITPNRFLSRVGVDVTILAANCTGEPASENGHKKNANSIVLLVEYQGAKIFLMGDAFVQTEQSIIDNFTKVGQLARLQKGPDDQVVLKMGHHGSDTSTSSDWVKLITPHILVVSSGTKSFNGKGMPTKTHLESTVGLTTLVPDTGIEQSFVVFDESKKGQPGQDFATMAKTKRGIWTTCYDVKWEAANKRWFESGQTWYYGVELVGKKLIASSWYGYTGYEDDDMDTDDDN